MSAGPESDCESDELRIAEEEDYNPHKRKRVVNQLEYVWNMVRALREATNNSHEKDIFFILEHKAFIDLIKASKDRYINRKERYRRRAQDRVRFVRENLDTSDTSNLSAKEFKEYYRMTRKFFF